MYKTIVQFKDLQDGNRLYRVGDEFPRAGLKVSEKRLEELSTSANRRKLPLIQKVVEIEQPQEITEPSPKPKRGRKKKENAD